MLRAINNDTSGKIDTGQVVRTSAQQMLALASPPQRIRSELVMCLTEHTYQPKVDEPRSDWVAAVTAPALQSYAQRHGTDQIRTFATIGTGSGLDALAAVETVAPDKVFVTDLHKDVVAEAQANIVRNILPDTDVELVGASGDLASPLVGSDGPFDLIYENLPNIPLPAETSLDAGQTSSTFIAQEHTGRSPSHIQDSLLELHYQFLRQARALLADHGRVLCSIGARVPLEQIFETFAAAGYHAELVLYTWKLQSEADDVVGGYASAEQRGCGPFRYVPVDRLQDAFAGADASTEVHEAKAIEQSLLPHTVTSVEALGMLRTHQLGHTVAVIEASPLAA